MHCPQCQNRALRSPAVLPFPSEPPVRKSLPRQESKMRLDLGLGTVLQIICFQALGWVPEFLTPPESAKALHSYTDDILAAWPSLPRGWNPGLAAPESERL